MGVCLGYHPNHADAEVTVDFEMRNNNSTIYALDNDTGEFKKGDIELTVIRVRGGHIGEEPIEAEREKRRTASNKAVHVHSLNVLPTLKDIRNFYPPIPALEVFNRKTSMVIREGLSKLFLYQCQCSFVCMNSLKWD